MEREKVLVGLDGKGELMLLKNKKTGEIKEFALFDGNELQGGVTLEILTKEWEDAPGEPKDFWFIDPEILIACESTDPLLCDKKVAIETMKQIGNYFDTREEAEKAVEKLKAFKRLKDKGFSFDLSPALGHCDDKKFDISIIGTMPAKWWYNDKVVDDIHYIFGGEE